MNTTRGTNCSKKNTRAQRKRWTKEGGWTKLKRTPKLKETITTMKGMNRNTLKENGLEVNPLPYENINNLLPSNIYILVCRKVARLTYNKKKYMLPSFFGNKFKGTTLESYCFLVTCCAPFSRALFTRLSTRNKRANGCNLLNTLASTKLG